MANIDYLIIGQGLAGSILGYKLHAQGATVKIIDNRNKSSSSAVAAGLIDPITGKRFALSWKIDTLRPYADDFYRDLERTFKTQFLHHKMSVRLFKSDEEIALYEQKKEEDGFKKYLHKFIPADPESPHFQNPFGGVQINHTSYLNIPLLLYTLRKYFERENLIVSTKCEQKDLQITSECVKWKSIEAKKIIFCDGFKASQNPYFKWLPWRHAKGEILTLDIPKMPRDRILHANGHWLLPTKEGPFKFGANYHWDTLDNIPTETERTELENALSDFIKHPFKLIDHQAGVRPILVDTKPVIGSHPQLSHVMILNGLSSKGVLLAPFIAEQFVQHLLKDEPIDPEIDIRRFSFANQGIQL